MEKNNFEIYKKYTNIPEIKVSENEYRDRLASEIKSMPKEGRVEFLRLNVAGKFYDKAKTSYNKEKEINKRVERGEISSVEEGWEEIANERVDTLIELTHKLNECHEITDTLLDKYYRHVKNTEITEEELVFVHQKLVDLIDFIKSKDLLLDLRGQPSNFGYLIDEIERFKKDPSDIHAVFRAASEFQGMGDSPNRYYGLYIHNFLFSTTRALNKLPVENTVRILSEKKIPKQDKRSGDHSSQELETRLWTIALNKLNTDNFSSLIKQVKDKVSPEYIEKFIGSNLNSSNIDKFLTDAVISELNPVVLLDIISKNTDVSDKKVSEIIKSIYENNRDNSELVASSLPLFGEKSLFTGFENQTNIEQKIFNEKINYHIIKLETKLPEVRKRIDRYYVHKERGPVPGFDFNEITNILEKISDGCDHKIKLENYEDIMSRINELSRFVSEDYAFANRDISKLESEVLVKLQNLFDQKPEGLTGDGLELFSNGANGTNIYHDGEYQLSVGSDARFSSKPSNHEKISYLTENRIDTSSIRGDQYRYQVYSFDIKTKELKEVFEIHSWIQEQPLLVSTPEVSENGEIIFKVYLDGEETEKKLASS